MSNFIHELDQQKRLQSPVFKGFLAKTSQDAFRGEIALKFAQQLADEARPPEVSGFQLIMAGAGDKLDFFTCEVLSLEHLQLITEVLGDYFKPTGKYFLFAGNVDISKKYLIEMNGIPFYVLPLDEATVYNEILDLFRLEKSALKRLDTGDKIAAIAEASNFFTEKFPAITFEQGLKEMGPIRIPENRPV
jgi:hypothetical protein